MTASRSRSEVRQKSKGLFCPSLEGELVLGGFGSRATPGALNNTWTFSAKDTKTIDKLTDAVAKGATVKITYRQWWIQPTCLDTPYEITDVVVVH